jgi:hypothetical protein
MIEIRDLSVIYHGRIEEKEMSGIHQAIKKKKKEMQ